MALLFRPFSCSSLPQLAPSAVADLPRSQAEAAQLRELRGQQFSLVLAYRRSKVAFLKERLLDLDQMLRGTLPLLEGQSRQQVRTPPVLNTRLACYLAILGSFYCQNIGLIGARILLSFLLAPLCCLCLCARSV